MTSSVNNDISISIGKVPIQISVESIQMPTQNKTCEITCRIFEFMKNVFWHVAVLIGKVIVIPVELSLMIIIATLTAISILFSLPFKCSLEEGEKPSLAQNLVAVLDELREVTCITLKYGWDCREKIQKADEEPESPEFVLILPAEGSLKENAIPTLYAPGYLDDPESLRESCRRIASQYGGPVYIVKYRSRLQSIEEHAKDIDRVAERIFKDTHRRDLILAGHSMGGIVTGWYMLNSPLQEINIKLWITIASPLKGVQMASWCFGKCANQMNPDAEIIKELNREDSLNAIPSLHVYSKNDLVVDFESTTRDGRPNAENYMCKQLKGHLGVRSCSEVENKIAEVMAKAHAYAGLLV